MNGIPKLCDPISAITWSPNPAYFRAIRPTAQEAETLPFI